MKQSTLIILAIVLLADAFLLVGVLQNQKQIESDLCYSLKINRIFGEGYEYILERLGEKTEPMDEFYLALEIMEERNWMGCRV